jgi:ectoine hydroxylase-related dioxygenase (phytanoyl-CoA dioxygenase family)
VSAVLSQKIAEDGFAILPDIFSSADIDNLIHGLVEFPLTRSRAGIRHAMHHPDVSEFAHDPLLCDMASSIFNQKAVPYRATLFDKSPDSNWLVVWHQDTALPRRERKEQTGWGPWSVKEGISYAHAPASALSEILALRLHLDDSHEENGPLRALPRTHIHGVLSDDQIHAFSEHVTPVDCLVPRGGVVAMQPLLIHASSKSTSDCPRRVLHIEYAPASSFENLGLAVA